MKNIILLVGIPGAGKSTYAKKISNNTSIIINADSVRKQLYGDENIQGNGKDVFSQIFLQFKQALLNPKINTIIVDNTNINYSIRKQYYTIIKNNEVKNYKINLVFFENFEKAKIQNIKRKRIVPDEVILKMINNYQGPNQFEKDNFFINYEN